MDNLNSSSHELLINPVISSNRDRQGEQSEHLKRDGLIGPDGTMMGTGNTNFRIKRTGGPNSPLFTSGTSITMSTASGHCGSSTLLNTGDGSGIFPKPYLASTPNLAVITGGGIETNTHEVATAETPLRGPRPQRPAAHATLGRQSMVIFYISLSLLPNYCQDKKITHYYSYFKIEI